MEVEGDEGLLVVPAGKPDCIPSADCFTPNAAATKRRCLRRKGVRQYGEERMRSFVQISLSIPTAA